MDLAYFKRYRMEISLTGRDFTPSLPAGYRFLGWQPSLLDAFAEAKYLSFRGEIDTNVFPCLGERAGCRRLMNEISQKPGFLAEATWLVEHVGEAGEESPYCGTIQGIRDHAGLGAIQNVGVTPAHRNGGVGTAHAAAGDAGVPTGRHVAGLLGSDRRERGGHPALPPLRLCDGEDRVQGGRGSLLVGSKDIS